MVDTNQMDCSNMGLLDGNFIRQNYPRQSGRRSTKRMGRKENYSNIAISADTVNAGIGAATSIAGAFTKSDAQKAAKAQKKEYKNVCGRRPILKKKRAAWQECVNKYVALKNPAPAPTPDAPTTPDNATSQLDAYAASKVSSGDGSDGEKKFYQKPLFIGTAVVVVVLGGFLIYTKFIKKAPIAIPTVTV